MLDLEGEAGALPLFTEASLSAALLAVAGKSPAAVCARGSRLAAARHLAAAASVLPSFPAVAASHLGPSLLLQAIRGGGGVQSAAAAGDDDLGDGDAAREAEEEEEILACCAAALAACTGGSGRPARHRSFPVLGPGRPAVRLVETDFAASGVGAGVWAAALVLAHRLASHEQVTGCEPFLGGRDVLELGSGCGLAGLAAGLLGARSVTLTDWLPSVLEGLARSAGLNGLRATVSVRRLDWRDELARDEAERISSDEAGPGPSPLPTPCCAFEPLPLGLRFERVLGSDVLYDPEHAVLLPAVLRQRLAPGGVFLMSLAVRDQGL